MEARLLPFEDGVEPLPPARGERGARAERRFGSGARVSPADKFAWCDRGGGCTDLAFIVLGLPKKREDSPDGRSIEVRVVSPPLSAIKLGRLLWLLANVSAVSPITPGPIDLRGALLPAPGFDTGG